MKAIQNTFMRYELKYLVSAEQRAALTLLINRFMKPDEFGRSTICNLYYDTPDMRLVRRSNEKPVYKEKLRVRSYGPCGPEDRVFVELKKKYDGVVYKRRVPMTLLESARYLASGVRPAGENAQILREIDWFLAHNPVEARAFIGYDRVALFGAEDPELRITFDRNIRAREDALDLRCGDRGDALLAPGQALMELKIGEAMPVWLSRILSDCAVRPASFSKYGVCYRDQIFAAQQPKGGVICA